MMGEVSLVFVNLSLKAEAAGGGGSFRPGPGSGRCQLESLLEAIEMLKSLILSSALK